MHSTFLLIQYISLCSQLNKLNNILFKAVLWLIQLWKFTTSVLNKLQYGLKDVVPVHCQNVDNENVNSHSVEVKMSKCRQWKWRKSEWRTLCAICCDCRNTCKEKKLSYLYVYFNIVSNPAQKVANLSVRIVVNEVSHTYWAWCSEPRVCDTFDIVTFAISIVNILIFRHYDFDIVTVDIFTVDIVTCHPLFQLIQLRLFSVA